MVCSLVPTFVLRAIKLMLEQSKYEIKTIPLASVWAIRHSVMWPDKPFDYIKLPSDPEGQHHGLFVRGQLVSIVSAFISSHEAQFRKFATLHAHQGQGYGSKLLTHLIAQLEAQHVKRIWCNARIDKQSFYERFGLNITPKTFSKGGIDYVVMEKLIAA